MHSDVETLERIELIRDLRLGVYDVLVGINLLREGLDIPECGLVAILDADKEGFLRSETSLIQTIGRAARNVDGRVILYADRITGAMERAIAETDRRREKQRAYNARTRHHAETIKRNIGDIIAASRQPRRRRRRDRRRGAPAPGRPQSRPIIEDLEKQMREAAADLEFEEAGRLRDEIRRLEADELGLPARPSASRRARSAIRPKASPARARGATASSSGRVSAAAAAKRSGRPAEAQLRHARDDRLRGIAPLDDRATSFGIDQNDGAAAGAVDRVAHEHRG